ncbi:MAG: DUF6445 family protein [Alphaproteobacteria bacterium]
MDTLSGKLRKSERLRYEVVRVGAELEPVLVVDDFLDDADVLVDYAAREARFDTADTFYPGVRAPIPPIYSFAIRAFLGPLIVETFGLGSHAVARELCSFSVVTTPPERLSVVQRLPHFDNTDPLQFAVLHYLCGPEHGGTAFYRHRATGFETMSDARFPDYKRTLETELRTREPPARYVGDDDPLFERTAGFDAVFNRVLIYRSVTLHCAQILPTARFDADPRAGRLTANVFYFYR